MSTATRVQSYLMTADLGRTNQSRAADDLHITVATMWRHLTDEGTRYSILVEAERKRRAQELLRENPNAHCSSILAATGYKPGKSLCTAFQRWFGVSLREYRRTA